MKTPCKIKRRNYATGTRTRVARVPGASRAASAPRTARTAKASACQCGRLTAAAAASVCCRGAEATPDCVKPSVGFEPTTSRLRAGALPKLKRHLGDAPQCSSPMFLHIAAFVSAVLRVASLKQVRAVHRRPAQRKAGMSQQHWADASAGLMRWSNAVRAPRRCPMHGAAKHLSSAQGSCNPRCSLLVGLARCRRVSLGCAGGAAHRLLSSVGVCLSVSFGLSVCLSVCPSQLQRH